MKSLIAGVLLATPLLANAYTWNDSYVNLEQISAGETLSWTHDITDSGFNAGSDTITNYSLGLFVSDDLLDPIVGWSGFFIPVFQSEWAGVSQGGSSTSFEVDFFDYIGIGGTISGIASLNSSGLLNVSLTGLSGDFYFGGSNLTATGTKGSASVPEPSSLALLAAGLIGIAAMRRKSAA